MKLGRREPAIWTHYEKFPLTIATTPLAPVPVVMGTNWYTNFDNPVKINGAWWIGRGNLGSVRGGHSYALRPVGITDSIGWWKFYNQGEEGACVGFGCSRCMTLLNRERYDGFWNYYEAQKRDEWPGEDYEGTSVRGGFEVLLNLGPRKILAGRTETEQPARGISEYRWARTVDEILAALGNGGRTFKGYVPVLNSWGINYPHVVRLPLETLDRLLGESGEAGIVTDR